MLCHATRTPTTYYLPLTGGSQRQRRLTKINSRGAVDASVITFDFLVEAHG